MCGQQSGADRRRDVSVLRTAALYATAIIHVIIIIIIRIRIFVYYSCSHNTTTEPASVTQDSTDTIEHKASIYNET